MNIRWTLSIISLLSLVALEGGAQTLPPVQSFVRGDDMSSLALSPDGRYVVYTTYLNGARAAITVDRQNGYTQRPVASANPEQAAQLQRCFWGNATRLLCIYSGQNYVRGQAFTFTRLAAVDADGSNVKVLLTQKMFSAQQFQASIVDMTPADPRTIMVNGDDDGDLYPDLYEVDIYTGDVHQVMAQQRRIRSFVSDGKGSVVYGFGYENGEYSYYSRTSTGWTQISRFKWQDEQQSLVPIGVAPEGDRIFMRRQVDGRYSIWAIDRDVKQEPQMVFAHPSVDVRNPWALANNELVGFIYNTDRRFIHYVDSAAQRVIENVRLLLPATFDFPIDRSDDGKVYLIGAESDSSPTTFYVLDSSTGVPKLIKLGSLFPDLDVKSTAKMTSVEFTARDGVRIPAFLVVKQGVEPKQVPLIVMLATGTQPRVWAFDPLDQFLASRGYALLLVRFRGTEGFGTAWRGGPVADWSGSIMSDIEDGTRWAISQGIADPKRACIFGAYMGGYVALLSAKRTNQLYSCAIALDAPSDLIDQKIDASSTLARQETNERLGDSTKLQAESPRGHADMINIPVMLLHHEKSTQVDIDHSEKMAAALTSKKKPHEFMRLETYQPADDLKMYQAIERFLGANTAQASPAN